MLLANVQTAHGGLGFENVGTVRLPRRLDGLLRSCLCLAATSHAGAVLVPYLVRNSHFLYLRDNDTFLVFDTLVQTSSGSSLNCSSCVENLQVVAQCAQTNGCNLTKCYGAATYSACCPACRDELQAATVCVGECSDSCVYATSNYYTSCLSSNPRCIPKCQQSLSGYASEVDGSANSYNVTYEHLQTADVSCQNIHEMYVTDACSIAGCCPDCIDEFESIMNCVVNEVVAEVVPSLQGELCDTSCSSRRSVRLLENDHGTAVNFFNLSSESNGFEVPNILDNCRRNLIEHVAFGDPANAAQDYTGCIQGRMMVVWDTTGGVNETSGAMATEYPLLGLILLPISLLASFLE
jgi:hypothetical protein